MRQARISKGSAPARFTGHHDYPLPDRYRRQRRPVRYPEIQRRLITRRGGSLGTVQMPIQASRKRWSATARLGSSLVRLVISPHRQSPDATDYRCPALSSPSIVSSEGERLAVAKLGRLSRYSLDVLATIKTRADRHTDVVTQRPRKKRSQAVS